jgi:Mce-associated membrane protein
MSDRRSRPRIAGQRRTAKPDQPDAPTPDAPTPDAAASDVAEDVAEDDLVEEPRPQDVTPATEEASEGVLEESPASEISTESEQKRGLGAALTAALGVVVVLTLTVAAVLGIKAWHGKQAEDARNQASAAGRKAAETALSYDYRDLDKSFAAARATMTPEFAAKFDETAKVAGELATKIKATVKADVREVGVRDGDADRVTLIIFVNQTTTSTITKGSPRVDLNRTRFTMVRNGDRWLVQEIVGL